MEIPTEETIEQLEILLPPHRQDAIKLIKDQAREILDLQATICRLKDEMQKMNRNECRAIEILVHGDGRLE